MFTPIETGIGSVLLHQATSIVLFQNGAVLGCSGYLQRLFSDPTKGTLAFFTGMAASLLPLKVFLPDLATVYPTAPSTLQAVLVTAGIGALVGWGTKVCRQAGNTPNVTNWRYKDIERLHIRTYALWFVQTQHPISSRSSHLLSPGHHHSSLCSSISSHRGLHIRRTLLHTQVSFPRNNAFAGPLHCGYYIGLPAVPTPRCESNSNRRKA